MARGPPARGGGRGASCTRRQAILASVLILGGASPTAPAPRSSCCACPATACPPSVLRQMPDADRSRILPTHALGVRAVFDLSHSLLSTPEEPRRALNGWGAPDGGAGASASW